MEKILIIDDELPVIQVLQDALSLGQYELLATQNPLDGIELIHQEHPYLILLDIDMQPINGLEVISRLVDDTDDSMILNKDYFIVVLTGVGSSELMHQCRDLGVEHFLNKPIHINVLRNTVDSLYQIRKTNEALKGLSINP